MCAAYAKSLGAAETVKVFIIYVLLESRFCVATRFMKSHFNSSCITLHFCPLCDNRLAVFLDYWRLRVLCIQEDEQGQQSSNGWANIGPNGALNEYECSFPLT